MKYLLKIKANYYFYEILFITMMLALLTISYIATAPKEKRVECDIVSGYCQQAATDIKVKTVPSQR